jgi:hypothetical protein
MVFGLDVVAHACNVSYWGGRVWEAQGLRPAWAKSQWDFVSNNKMLGIVMHGCHPRHVGRLGSKPAWA